MLKRMLLFLCLVGVFGLGTTVASAQAQSASADLTGTVADPSRAYIGGATITVTNIATGLQRTAATDPTGTYRIPLLPPGEYEIKAEMNGFAPQRRRGVALTVGQTVNISFELAIGIKSEVEVVETSLPLIETERTHQAGTITQKAITNLPINGRNFLDFARLTPGVVEENPTILDAQLPFTPSSGLSFAGQNGRANSVQIDGVDNNDIGTNGVRPTISQEAVREFQINRSSYSAEFGRASGGVINIVSRSGTNEFHGNFYNFFRNERLDARNTFAAGQKSRPPFKRNQPGFTFGGPLSRDKTFFFAAYEGLIRRESSFTSILSDPSILLPTTGQQDLINTLSASGDPALAAQARQLATLLTTSSNSPLPTAAQPFPLNRLTYRLLSDATGAFPVRETSSTGSLRFDHSLSEQDYFFLRYNTTNNSRNGLRVGGLVAPSGGFNLAIRDHNVVFGNTHNFRNSATNELRFQYVRSIFKSDPADSLGPRVEIAGIGSFGRDIFGASDRTQRRFQIVDNYAIARGKHSLKAGIDYSGFGIDFVSPAQGGNIEFAQLNIPLASVLDARTTSQLTTLLSTPRAAGGLERPDLIPVVTAQPLTTIQQFNFGFARAIDQGFGNPSANLPGQIFGLYLQDNLKILPNLLINMGLRYDYQMQPDGVPTDGNNFGPRLSFAYDPFKDGKTVIRGGVGVNFQSLYSLAGFLSVLGNNLLSTNILVSADSRLTPITPDSVCGQALSAGTPPSFCFFQQLVGRGLLNFPSTRTIPESAYLTLAGLTRETSTNKAVLRLAPDAITPYSVQSSFGIDRQFGGDWNVSLNYMVNHGLHLLRLRQVNALPHPSVQDVFGRPALIARADQTRLADYVLETAGSSIYHGLAVSANKRFSRLYQIIGSYTFGKAIDDSTDFIIEQGPQDPTNPGADRSLSSFNVRHRLSFSAILNSPYTNAAAGSWYQRALADFYFAPIITARSGFPFNIRTGIDINFDNNNNDRPFAVGRNTGLGPLFYAVDMRLGRRVAIGTDTGRSVEFIFDVFNLFNRVNYRQVNSTTGGVLFLDQLGFTDVRVKGSSRIPASSFGGFTSAYDPRVLQLAIKLNF